MIDYYTKAKKTSFGLTVTKILKQNSSILKGLNSVKQNVDLITEFLG